MYTSSLSSSLLLVSLAWLAGKTSAHYDYEHEHGHLNDTQHSSGHSLYQKMGTHLFPRQYTIDSSCASKDQNLINAEFTNAANIASYAQTNLGSSAGTFYTSAFIPASLLSVGIAGQLAAEYGNGVSMKSNTNYQLTVTCSDTGKFCQKGYYASMSDRKVNAGTMNLCSAWFDVAGTPAELKGMKNLLSTADILAVCRDTNSQYQVLQDFWWSRAQSLVHEWSHTRFFMGGAKSIDYAYSVQKCLNLAAGSYMLPEDRATRGGNDEPICPDKDVPTRPGFCDPNLSIDNADTLSIIAGGLWFSDQAQCNRVIPIGATAQAPSTRKYKGKRQDAGDDGSEIALDPPYEGFGFASISCDDPDANGCCGECTDPTSTSTLVSSTSTPDATSTSTSVSGTSTSSSLMPTITTAPPCLMHEDPDSGTPPTCQCSNGVNIPPVISTNTAGQTGQYCPWTTLPPQAITTTQPPTSPTTAAPLYIYTYTNPYGQVDWCQSTKVSKVAGYTLTMCESSAIHYQPPTMTLEMGSSQVNIGTSMTGDVLYTSISNALSRLCPTPTIEGTLTGCETGTIEVGEATWLDQGTPENGQVTIKVADAQYNSSDTLNMFINMLAGGFNASGTGDNCQLLDWTKTLSQRDSHTPVTKTGKDTFCNTNGFLDLQYFSGLQETAELWLEAELGFNLGELGSYDCKTTAGVVGETVGRIFETLLPEIQWLIEGAVQLGEIACDIAETFNPPPPPPKKGSRSLLRDLEKSIADEKLAKAWAKEMKKERRLPMPEHKKRELGLID